MYSIYIFSYFFSFHHAPTEREREEDRGTHRGPCGWRASCGGWRRRAKQPTALATDGEMARVLGRGGLSFWLAHGVGCARSDGRSQGGGRRSERRSTGATRGRGGIRCSGFNGHGNRRRGREEADLRLHSEWRAKRWELAAWCGLLPGAGAAAGAAVGAGSWLRGARATGQRPKGGGGYYGLSFYGCACVCVLLSVCVCVLVSLGQGDQTAWILGRGTGAQL